MFRHLLTLLLGVATTALTFFVFVIPEVRESWRTQGFNEGNTSARWEIAEKLEKEFPNQPNECKDGHNLFNVKTISVYVLECPQGKHIHVER
jgi:hypothetical protein